MLIKSRGYNVPEVAISTALTSGTKTKIGSVEEHDKLLAIVKKSGVCRGHFELGGQEMDGTAMVNFEVDGTGMEFNIITNHDDTPVMVSLWVVQEDDGCYCTPSIISLS